MANVDVSIILACYNEGPTLDKNVNQIVRVLEKINKKWEVIFVEDKSTDETKKTVEKLTEQIKNSRLGPFDFAQGFGGQAKAIYHAANQGRGKTVADGIEAAKGAICGYLDVDLEVSCDYIPIFINEIEKGADIAVGKRFYEGGLKSLPRFLASKTYAQIVKMLLKIPFDDTEAGYKFFNRSKILPILSKVSDKQWFWDTEICAKAYWAGLSISQVPILFIRRSDKKSTVRLIPDSIAYLVNLIRFRDELNKLKGKSQNSKVQFKS